jgi:leucyl-tRNA synthetase
MILAKGGEKMSKSKGNVVNPDEMVEQYGADVLRTYIMFMGPFDQAVEWDTNGLVGVRRFLEKVWNMQDRIQDEGMGDEEWGKGNSEIIKSVHKTIKKVGEDIEGMHFNTAVAAMMELSNDMNKLKELPKDLYENLIKILSPFAPHMCEEIWQSLGHDNMISLSEWPEYDPELCKDETIVLDIQINGKIRYEIEINVDDSEEIIKEQVLNRDKVQHYIKDKELKKFIVVKGKIISIVV